MRPVSRVSLLLVAAFTLAFAGTGCSALKKAKKSAAKAMGVKVKTETVGMGDLGPEYSALKDTEWDAFSKTASAQPLAIKYKQFGVKSVDSFIAEANNLYASYKLANTVADKSYADLQQFVQADIYAVEEKELRTALAKKSADHVHQVERFNVLKQNLEFFATSLGSMVEKGNGVKDAGMNIQGSVVNDFQKDPAKALVVDEAVAEVKLSVERVVEVVTGAPELGKKVYRMKDVIDWAQQEAANPGAHAKTAGKKGTASTPAKGGATAAPSKGGETTPAKTTGGRRPAPPPPMSPKKK